MEFRYRKALGKDAKEVASISAALSYPHLLASGLNEEMLSQSGFLLYPLEANDDNKPNYLERIEAAEHFWVVENSGSLVAFLMAYTFDCLRSIAYHTDNDVSIMEHFIGRMGMRGNVIYCAQLAVLPEYQKRGIAISLNRHAFDGIDGADYPAAICEIGQEPIWNEPSSLAFERCGFTPLFLRRKAMPYGATRHRRSATFVRTFPCRRKPSGPVVM